MAKSKIQTCPPCLRQGVGRRVPNKSIIKKIIKSFVISLIYLSLVICNLSFAQELTLKQAIDIALAKNPQITTARENLNAASARMGQAGSAILPQINFSGTLGKTYNQPMLIQLPPILGGGTIATAPDEPADLSMYNFTLSQTLFTGGKILSSMAIAKINYDIMGLYLTKAKNDVSFSALSAFYNVLDAQKSLKIVDESLSNLKRNMKEAQVFSDSGLIAYTDLLRAKTAVANMEITKIQAQAGLSISMLVLETALGQKLPPDTVINDEELPGLDKLSIGADETLNKAYQYRPEWLSFELGIKAAKDALNISYSGYLPDILYSYSSGNTKTDYKKAGRYFDLNNWRSTFSASWDLFDGFDTQNKIRESYAQLNSAKAQEASLKDNLSLEVNSAYLNLKAAVEKVKASEIAADLAERSYKATEVNFKSGTASEQYFLEAETYYHNSETALWSARYDLEVAKAKLNNVVGTKVI